MVNKMPPTENHPADNTQPSFQKGSFESVGTFAPLKDSANSPNSKSGEPFGQGGK